MGRGPQADVDELGGTAGQRVQGDLDAGGDGTPEESTGLVERDDLGGRAEVHDDGGQCVLVLRRDGHRNKVRADFRGVVGQDVDAGLHTGAHQKRGLSGDFFDGVLQRSGDLRNDGRDDGTGEAFLVDVVQLEDAGEVDGDAVSGGMVIGREPGCEQQFIAFIGTDGDVRVTGVDDK